MNLPEAAGRYLVAESAGAEGDFFGDGAQTRAEQLVAFGYAAVGVWEEPGRRRLGLPLEVDCGVKNSEILRLASSPQASAACCSMSLATSSMEKRGSTMNCSRTLPREETVASTSRTPRRFSFSSSRLRSSSAARGKSTTGTGWEAR